MKKKTVKNRNAAAHALEKFRRKVELPKTVYKRNKSSIWKHYLEGFK